MTKLLKRYKAVVHGTLTNNLADFKHLKPPASHCVSPREFLKVTQSRSSCVKNQALLVLSGRQSTGTIWLQFRWYDLAATEWYDTAANSHYPNFCHQNYLAIT